MKKYIVKLGKFKPIWITKDFKKVIPSGNFSLPAQIGEFNTPEEAEACIKGIEWAVKYYGGEFKQVDSIKQ